MNREQIRRNKTN